MTRTLATLTAAALLTVSGYLLCWHQDARIMADQQSLIHALYERTLPLPSHTPAPVPVRGMTL